MRRVRHRDVLLQIFVPYAARADPQVADLSLFVYVAAPSRRIRGRRVPRSGARASRRRRSGQIVAVSARRSRRTSSSGRLRKRSRNCGCAAGRQRTARATARSGGCARHVAACCSRTRSRSS
jgi:hypothetical protein